MYLNPGDHICAIYATEEELAGMVAPYLAGVCVGASAAGFYPRRMAWPTS